MKLKCLFLLLLLGISFCVHAQKRPVILEKQLEIIRKEPDNGDALKFLCQYQYWHRNFNASPLSGSFLMISNCFSRMTGRFCACTQKDIPKSNSKKRHFSFICFFSVESANIIKPLIFLVQKSCIFKIKSYLCNAFNKKHF